MGRFRGWMDKILLVEVMLRWYCGEGLCFGGCVDGVGVYFLSFFGEKIVNGWVCGWFFWGIDYLKERFE